MCVCVCVCVCVSLDFYCRYDHLRNEVQLDSVPGMVFCPRTLCGSRVASEPDSDLAVCAECGFPFCKLCKQTWHGAGPCPALVKVTTAVVLQTLSVCPESYYVY